MVSCAKIGRVEDFQEGVAGRAGKAGEGHPLEGKFGTAFRFYGNGSYHYTVPNETDITRISIDFRWAKPRNPKILKSEMQTRRLPDHVFLARVSLCFLLMDFGSLDTHLSLLFRV
jgi:hypothetical protein